MRARGAQATDIAILVVAADDGVMPQTVEAINHARAAEVPIVVAVTKVDREDADPTRVRQQLVERELVPEEWGGDTIVVDVAPPDGHRRRRAARVDPARRRGRGARAPTRRSRHARSCSSRTSTRAAARSSPRSSSEARCASATRSSPAARGARSAPCSTRTASRCTEAGPSVPVEVLGLDDVPLAGDELRVAPDEKIARTVAEARAHRRRAASLKHPMSLAGGARLEDIFAMVQRGEVATLNLVLKADVQGSLEAVTDALRKLDQEHEEVRLSFVHRARRWDHRVRRQPRGRCRTRRSSASTCVPTARHASSPTHEGVEMRLYEVIYQVLEDVQSRARRHAQARVRRSRHRRGRGARGVLGAPRRQGRRVATCATASSPVARRCGSCARAWSSGTARSRRCGASRTTSARCSPGFECGIGLENYQDLKPGDVIETYDLKEIARG